MSLECEGERHALTDVPAVSGIERGVALEWRRLGPHLWAARRNGFPAGCVERRRGFVVLDLGADECGRYRTLAEAQAHVMHDRRAVSAPNRCGTPLRRVGCLCAGAGLLVAGYVLGLALLMI